MLPFVTGTIEFQCRGERDGKPCKKTHKVRIRPAELHSQTGQIMPCLNCGAWYALTDDAVMQIPAPGHKFVDAEGKPYGNTQAG